MEQSSIRKRRIPYKLYLLLLSPLVIIFFLLVPQTQSKWENEAGSFQQKDPTNQGWNQVTFKEEPITESEEDTNS